jgi:hypothetical protein
MAVFLSFHYDRDAARVQQVVNMGALEQQTILSAQDWEGVKKKGDAAIQTWIDDQMKYKTAVVVLIGKETASRPWVTYEIRKAWNEKRPLLGIRINGLAPLNLTADAAGANPFSNVPLDGGDTVADYVPIFTPTGNTSKDVYSSIAENLGEWITLGYKRS